MGKNDGGGENEFLKEGIEMRSLQLGLAARPATMLMGVLCCVSPNRII